MEAMTCFLRVNERGKKTRQSAKSPSSGEKEKREDGVLKIRRRSRKRGGEKGEFLKEGSSSGGKKVLICYRNWWE